MKQISMACAIGAALCISSAAFAQTNPPSSATGLQAGDNAQTVPTHKPKSGTSHHKMKKSKTMSSGDSSTPGAGGTATPSGPGAPVTASGSGQ